MYITCISRFLSPLVIPVCHIDTSHATNFGVHQGSKMAVSAPWAWHVIHAGYDITVVILISLSAIYVHHIDKLCNTKLGVYQPSEVAASAPWAWHVSHVVHDMDVMIFILSSVIYVCHTNRSCNTKFGVWPHASNLVWPHMFLISIFVWFGFRPQSLGQECSTQTVHYYSRTFTIIVDHCVKIAG